MGDVCDRLRKRSGINNDSSETRSVGTKDWMSSSSHGCLSRYAF